MSTPPPPFTLDAATARVHAGEYLLLSAIEAGLADGYDRARHTILDHRAPLYRSLDLAAVGARRRAGHYAHLARTMSAYAQADTEDRPGMLARVGLDLTDVHDGGAALDAATLDAQHAEDRGDAAGGGRDAG